MNSFIFNVTFVNKSIFYIVSYKKLFYKNLWKTEIFPFDNYFMNLEISVFVELGFKIGMKINFFFFSVM